MKFAERWVVGGGCWRSLPARSHSLLRKLVLRCFVQVQSALSHVQYLNCIPAVSASPALDTHNSVYLQYLLWLSSGAWLSF